VSADEARIPRLPADDAKAAAEGAGVPTYYADLSIFQVLLRHPDLAKVLGDLLTTLLFRGSLDTRLRELVIMRLGWATGSVYEWTQHWRIAAQLGVPEADLVGVRDWQSHAGFDAADRAVLAATDETLTDGAISAATWDACREHIGDDKALLELATAIGLWRMVSSFLRSLAIPLEDGVEPWPPDGKVPPG
jgi:alkylhydroperoxidase family enzyme